MSLLFANKALFQLGGQIFCEHATTEYDKIFEMRETLRLSCVSHQVPWDRIRFTSGSGRSTDHLDAAVSEELLSIKHLRRITVRSGSVVRVRLSDEVLIDL